MNRKRTWILGSVVTLGLAVMAAWGSNDAPGDAPSAALAPDDWARGETRLYRVELEMKDEAMLPGGAEGEGVSADATFRGAVEVTYRGPHNGNRLFSWSIDDVETLSIVFGDQEVDIPSGAVTGFDLLVEADARGAVEAVHVDEDVPEVVRNLLRTVATESQLVRSERDRWAVSERALRGRARAHFERKGTVIEKIRDEYTSLSSLAWIADPTALDQDIDSRFRFSLDPQGRVDAVNGSEDVHVVDDDGSMLLASGLTLSMTLRDTRVADYATPQAELARLVAARKAYAADEVIPSAEAARNALVAQTRGMTPEQLHGWLASFTGDFGDDPAFSERLWQATGLLALRPELCAGVAEFFDRPDTTPEQRLLSLDVLAATGHDAAQQSLVDALSSETGNADSVAFAGYVQRAAMVEKPNSELSSFVATRLDDAESDEERFASAYTLASMSRHAREAGDEAQAEAAAQRVARELRSASTAEEEAHLLKALSNTGSPDNAEIAASYVDAESWTVRAAAAESLHGVNTIRAREVLTDLLADGHPMVQGTALRKLERFPVGQFDVASVRDWAVEGGVTKPAFHQLLGYAQHAPAGPERDEILRYVIDNSPDNPGLRNRAAKALRSSVAFRQ